MMDKYAQSNYGNEGKENAQMQQKQTHTFCSVTAGEELQVHERDGGSAEDHSSVLFPRCKRLEAGGELPKVGV